MKNAIIFAAIVAGLFCLTITLLKDGINTAFEVKLISRPLIIILTVICFAIVMAVYAPGFIEAHEAPYAFTCGRCGKSYFSGDPDGKRSDISNLCNVCYTAHVEQTIDEILQESPHLESWLY